MHVKSIIFQVADSLIRVSRQLGITTTAVITEMDNPLGRAVGNSLEVSLWLNHNYPTNFRNFVIFISVVFMNNSLVIYISGKRIHSMSQRKGTTWPWRIGCDWRRTSFINFTRFAILLLDTRCVQFFRKGKWSLHKGVIFLFCAINFHLHV